MSSTEALHEIVDSTVAALNCLVAGDPEPFKALYSHEPDVTVFGGFGAYERGWDQVGSNVDWAASRFRGGQLRVESLAMGASGDLAYTVWIERGEVRVAGRDDYAPLVVRVTHIFRRENGAWKLIHRHGDPVVEKTEATAILQR
jgi:ketosteroid isomerase-like protein